MRTSKHPVIILGGSGYIGSELLRILLFHPRAEIVQVISPRRKGIPVSEVHPNLEGFTSLRFEKPLTNLRGWFLYSNTYLVPIPTWQTLSSSISFRSVDRWLNPTSPF